MKGGRDEGGEGDGLVLTKTNFVDLLLAAD